MVYPRHILKTSPWRVRKLGKLRNLGNLGNIGQDEMMSELSELSELDCCLLFGLYQSQATLVWTSIGFKYFFSARKISTRKVSLLGRFT